MEQEIKKTIMEAIRAYAQNKGISLYGESYQTYSLLKSAPSNFPVKKMFLSNNARGKIGQENVTIVFIDKNTIGHFKTEHILEKPIERLQTEQRMHRVITPFFDISLSF